MTMLSDSIQSFYRILCERELELEKVMEEARANNVDFYPIAKCERSEVSGILVQYKKHFLKELANAG